MTRFGRTDWIRMPSRGETAVGAVTFNVLPSGAAPSSVRFDTLESDGATGGDCVHPATASAHENVAAMENLLNIPSYSREFLFGNARPGACCSARTATYIHIG